MRRVAIAPMLLALPATVLGLAGCDDGDAFVAELADVPALAPQVEWADRMCAAVVQTSPPLTPPKTDQSDVGATLQTLVDMFDTMAGLLDEQHAKLHTVGRPPEGSDRAFRTAMRHLAEAHGLARRVERSLSRSAAASPDDLQEALGQIGALWGPGADYPGFVLDLVGLDRDLLPAIAQAPTCANLGVS
ncbi:hypothetical protein F0U44_12990 [Nocardioides humilatus]|uniref:Uncharacterized protein n=1 Tax=Nocardioides humilatus TaxID=2607660 RepID=A0A5B1LHS5_9ACTN|nr:hypothetical protein [Nocardioides humilatus]KAA1419350.1 hypothetical protein F0U44_12990 [Nocardioides humilatus]